MNKSVLVVSLLAGAVTAFGQVGTISGKNFGFAGGAKAPVFEPDGVTLEPAATGRVEILFNGSILTASAGSSTVIVTDGTGNKLAAAGLFALGSLDVAGTQPGATVTVTIEAWDNSTGATFATATTKASETVSVTLGGGTSAPAALSAMTPLTLSVTQTPEPSTYALAALGLGGLLFISRRK